MLLRALEDIEMGDEICTNYYHNDPERLLNLYGFVEEGFNSIDKR